MGIEPQRFFERPQAAAKLKHEILGGYLRPFVQKVGSTAPGKTVAYIDGYAGPGQYDDATPGSPAIAVRVADVVANVDSVVGHLVESDPACHEALRKLIEETQPTWRVYNGTVEEHLNDILGAIDGLPLFAFLDPFGLGLPLETLTSTLLTRTGPNGRRIPTEVLLNFSLPGLRRNAGHLGSTSSDVQYLSTTRNTFLQKMDAAMGGDWWQKMWTDEPAETRELKVFEKYLQRLCSGAGSWSAFTVPVSDRWKGPIDYYLVLLTQHPDGAWLFNDTVSNALEKYRMHCLEESGQLDLEPLSDREPLWINAIAANIESLLSAGSFVVKDEIKAVYGDTLGFAREKHVRKAIKQLYGADLTSTSGIGKIPPMIVVPTTTGSPTTR